MGKSLKRVFNTGWTNFKRNSYMTFGTTGVIVLVLLLFAGLVAVNFISTSIVTSLQDKIDVTVYFSNDASELEIATVQDDLTRLSTVKNVEFISRDQALADFKERHVGDTLIQESLAELDENPLQASLNVKAKDASQYASIVNFLEGNKFRTLIDKINFYENEGVIGRVDSISKGIQNWGLFATLLLAFVAVLVTFNTIRLTIYNQKQEIEIMRLVGGSNWHIRAPYIIEGGLYGGIAALIALGIFYPATYVISPKVEALMPGVSLISYFGSNIFQFIPLILFIGISLGVVSSIVVIRKFLKI